MQVSLLLDENIIQRVIEAFPNREAMDTVTYITTDWL